ncbi:MAG: DUF4167 domain-containing protein [Bryobacteraceae bacterium]
MRIHRAQQSDARPRRLGAKVKRSRRGGRRPQHAGGGGHSNGGGGGGGGGNNFNPNRTFDSSGPEVKIRGSASNVYEKYLQLARDANANGDRVMAESYLQHAEHYYRIMAAQQAQMQQYQQQQALQQQRSGNGGGNGADQPFVPAQPGQSAPSFSLAEGDEEGEEEAAE